MGVGKLRAKHSSTDLLLCDHRFCYSFIRKCLLRAHCGTPLNTSSFSNTASTGEHGASVGVCRGMLVHAMQACSPHHVRDLLTCAMPWLAMCRLLFGSMRVTSYDWANPAHCNTIPEPNEQRLACQVADTVLQAPAPPMVLYPCSGRADTHVKAALLGPRKHVACNSGRYTTAEVHAGDTLGKEGSKCQQGPCPFPQLLGCCALLFEPRCEVHHVADGIRLALAAGNIHEFRAETPCAVLDILAPPYEPDLGEWGCVREYMESQVASQAYSCCHHHTALCRTTPCVSMLPDVCVQSMLSH